MCSMLHSVRSGCDAYLHMYMAALVSTVSYPSSTILNPAMPLSISPEFGQCRVRGSHDLLQLYLVKTVGSTDSIHAKYTERDIYQDSTYDVIPC